jgi:hypothetical protein
LNSKDDRSYYWANPKTLNFLPESQIWNNHSPLWQWIHLWTSY